MTMRARVARLGRIARASVDHPRESLERAREKLAERQDSRGGWPEYEPSPDAEERMHRMLGAQWPCHEREEFQAVWSGLLGDLRDGELAVGRGAFGGWDDGDPGLVRASWCLTRHLRPQVVLETGVARGLTSATILRAMERNGTGHLWSVDLPPLLDRDLGGQTGVAVGAADRSRWTLLRGSTRRQLPGLLGELGDLDLFIHDSMHTGRNVEFELTRIWPALRPGGAALVDDVDRNAAFGRFAGEHANSESSVQRADDGLALFGFLVKR